MSGAQVVTGNFLRGTVVRETRNASALSSDRSFFAQHSRLSSVPSRRGRGTRACATVGNCLSENDNQPGTGHTPTPRDEGLPRPQFHDEDLSKISESAGLDEFQRLRHLGIPLQGPPSAAVSSTNELFVSGGRNADLGSSSVQETEVKIPDRVSHRALKERAKALSLASKLSGSPKVILSETRKLKMLERMAEASQLDMAAASEMDPPLVKSSQFKPSPDNPGQMERPILRKKRRNADRLSPRQLTQKITEYRRKRQLGRVFSLLEEARQYGKQPNTIVMNAAMAACVDCGNVEKALELFEEMTSASGCGVDGITYGTLLKGLGNARLLDDAFELLESMEAGTAPGAPELTEVHLNTLVNACADAGDARRAQGVLQRFRKFGKGVGPSVLTYNLLIKGYARSDNPLEALAVVEEMQLQGLPLERFSYNSLLLACIRGGELERALDLLQEMKGEAWRQRELGLWPDMVSYTTILQGLAEDGDLEGILNLVREMKSGADSFLSSSAMEDAEASAFLEGTKRTSSLDRVAYGAVIDACLAVGSTSYALSFLREMESLSSSSPSLRPRAHVFLSLMRGLARQGHTKAVGELRDRLARGEAGGRVWAEDLWQAEELMLEALVASGKIWEAESQFRSMVQRRAESSRPVSMTVRGIEAVVRLSAVSELPLEQLKPVQLKEEVAPRAPVEVHMQSVRSVPCLSLSSSREDLEAALDLGQTCAPVLNGAGECVGVMGREHLERWECTPLVSLDSLDPPPRISRFAPTGDAASLMLSSGAEVIAVISGDSRLETGLLKWKTKGPVGGENRAVGFLFRRDLF